MRFTTAFISALLVATGLAAPALKVKDAAPAPAPEAKDDAPVELDARWKCIVDPGCMKGCASVGINPGLCAPSCTYCP